MKDYTSSNKSKTPTFCLVPWHHNSCTDNRIMPSSYRHSGMMHLILGVTLVLLVVPIFSEALADAYIPKHEYFGYFDSNDIYTIVGNVKNENDFAIIPTITVHVADDSRVYSKKITHVPIAANQEVPFKTKFLEIRGTPILQSPDLTFVRIDHRQAPLKVLYDDTLVKHDDGHLTGRVQNTGDKTIHFPTVHAVVHGHQYPLDIVQNINFIEKIEPGQTVGFTMYPDPAITDDISYYSCFAPVDTTVIPVTADKDGGKFDFRYDSGAWFSAAKFDGGTLTMHGYNSYPLETYANFEFAPISGDEQFSVTINDTPVEFIQSIDEMGFWHVAFSVEPTSQMLLEISGFEEGLPAKLPLVPQWVKANAGAWSTGQIPDSEFLKAIDFLLEKQIIVPQEIVAAASWEIRPWIKIISGWWYEEKITDEDFINALSFLIDSGAIRI